jgi:DNA-binding phage protein
MARRAGNWDEVVAKELRAPGALREYLLINMKEHGEKLEAALRWCIESYGVSEFSRNFGIPRATLDRIIKGEHNWISDKMKEVLKVFDVRLTVEPIKTRPRMRLRPAHAAA